MISSPKIFKRATNCVVLYTPTSEGAISLKLSSFTFPTTDLRINLTPSVPQWALDMEVELHPNDIRTLVRVVNELGQEVDPNSTPYGTVLFYIFNDATVEKRVNSKF